MKDTDLITSVIGYAGAVVTAANPVVTAVSPGASMHAQDWTQLIMAVIFGLLGHYTNKKGGE
jgi:hypothetical protein